MYRAVLCQPCPDGQPLGESGLLQIWGLPQSPGCVSLVSSVVQVTLKFGLAKRPVLSCAIPTGQQGHGMQKCVPQAMQRPTQPGSSGVQLEVVVVFLPSLVTVNDSKGIHPSACGVLNPGFRVQLWGMEAQVRPLPTGLLCVFSYSPEASTVPREEGAVELGRSRVTGQSGPIPGLLR